MFGLFKSKPPSKEDKVEETSRSAETGSKPDPSAAGPAGLEKVAAHAAALAASQEAGTAVMEWTGRVLQDPDVVYNVDELRTGESQPELKVRAGGRCPTSTGPRCTHGL